MDTGRGLEFAGGVATVVGGLFVLVFGLACLGHCQGIRFWGGSLQHW